MTLKSRRGSCHCILFPVSLPLHSPLSPYPMWITIKRNLRFYYLDFSFWLQIFRAPKALRDLVRVLLATKQQKPLTGYASAVFHSSPKTMRVPAQASSLGSSHPLFMVLLIVFEFHLMCLGMWACT